MKKLRNVFAAMSTQRREVAFPRVALSLGTVQRDMSLTVASRGTAVLYSDGLQMVQKETERACLREVGTVNAANADEYRPK